MEQRGCVRTGIQGIPPARTGPEEFWLELRSAGGRRRQFGRGSCGQGLRPGRPGFRLRFRCRPRSEEHTSELQSLMRISYAVFCLKKKNLKSTTITILTLAYTNSHSK